MGMRTEPESDTLKHRQLIGEEWFESRQWKRERNIFFSFFYNLKLLTSILF